MTWFCLSLAVVCLSSPRFVPFSLLFLFIFPPLQLNAGESFLRLNPPVEISCLLECDNTDASELMDYSQKALSGQPMVAVPVTH